MKQRPGRARRRGPSVGEKFGRFKAETDRFRAQTEERLARLERGHQQLAAVNTEILAHLVEQASTVKRIDERTEIFAGSVAHIDNFIKRFGELAEKEEGA